MKNKSIKTLSLLLIVSMTLSLCACTGERKKSAKDDLPIDPSAVSKQQESSEKAESVIQESEDNSPVPAPWRDKGIFSPYYEKAYLRMKKMTTEQKVGQVILARCPYEDAFNTATDYFLGGYMMFYNNFEGKNKDDVIRMTRSLTESQDIPMIIASDEEGGLVSRITGITGIAEDEFLSPRELFDQGGMDAIKKDALKKSMLLNDLGINTNLAPVCDICTGEDKFMYERSLGQGPTVTSAFVENITSISQSNGVSVTLKHFPGYGNNADTHTGIAIDKRPIETFESTDLMPFRAGIDAGAHVVMVTHNIVECMDKERPASLSSKVHELLRNELGFTGIVVTDDLEMGAIKEYSDGKSAAAEAFIAGNDMVCVSNIGEAYQSIYDAVNSGEINSDKLDRSVMRIIAWKYAKGLLTE